VRLRHKAIALFLGCALLPAATVGVGAYHVARTVIAAAVGDELALAARDTLDALEGRLAEAADQLETWSGLHVMQDVLLRDAGGEVRDELAELLVTDDPGTVVAATRPENVGKDLSAEAAVAEARAGGRYQGTVGSSGLAPGTVLAMAVPVRAKYDGTTVVGVLLGLVDWDQVRRELAAVPLAGAAQDAGHLLELRSRADGSLLYGTAAAPSGRDGFLVRAAARAPAARSRTPAGRWAPSSPGTSPSRWLTGSATRSSGWARWPASPASSRAASPPATSRGR